MINGPRRIFRDTGERIERVTEHRLRRRPPAPRLPRTAARAASKGNASTGSRHASRRASPTAPGSPPRSRPSPRTATRSARSAASPSAPARSPSSSSSAFLSERSRSVPRRLRPRRQEHRRRRPRLLGQDDAPERARASDPGPGARRRLRILGRAPAAADPRQLRRLRGTPGEPRRAARRSRSRTCLRRAADEPRPDHRRRMPRPRNDGAALVVRDRPRRDDLDPRRVRRARAQEPRPLRPHLRRPHRGRTGTRLAPGDRHRRPLRPAAKPDTAKAQLPAPPGRRDRRSQPASKETGPPSTRSSKAPAADLRWLGVRPRFAHDLADAGFEPPA